MKNYDVLTICSSTPLAHTDEEVKLIKHFVESGGGLLLASSTSRFERDVAEFAKNSGKPLSRCEELRTQVKQTNLIGTNRIQVKGCPNSGESGYSAEMGINKVAAIFGAEFLLLDEGKGEMNLSADPVRGYPKKSLRFTEHEVVAGLELGDVKIANCGILSISAEAKVFLEHSETKEPIGACLNFGKGRVLLV